MVWFMLNEATVSSHKIVYVYLYKTKSKQTKSFVQNATKPAFTPKVSTYATESMLDALPTRLRAVEFPPL